MSRSNQSFNNIWKMDIKSTGKAEGISGRPFRETETGHPRGDAGLHLRRIGYRPAARRRPADTGKGAHGASLRGRQPHGYPAQAARSPERTSNKYLPDHQTTPAEWKTGKVTWKKDTCPLGKPRKAHGRRKPVPSPPKGQERKNGLAGRKSCAAGNTSSYRSSCWYSLLSSTEYSPLPVTAGKRWRAVPDST